MYGINLKAFKLGEQIKEEDKLEELVYLTSNEYLLPKKFQLLKSDGDEGNELTELVDFTDLYNNILDEELERDWLSRRIYHKCSPYANKEDNIKILNYYLNILAGFLNIKIEV